MVNGISKRHRLSEAFSKKAGKSCESRRFLLILDFQKSIKTQGDQVFSFESQDVITSIG